MLRSLLLAGALALVLAAPSPAQVQLLMPAVTYEKQVQFTNHGPVVLHVMIAPKPGGLYSLEPVLSNGLIPDKQTVTAMQKAVSGSGTVAGVNGDLFNFNDGHPTGILIRDGVLEHRPSPDRSSLGVDALGNVHVDKVAMFATWVGSGQRRPILSLNEPAGANGVALYTSVWGPTTPLTPGSYEVALSQLPPTIANTDVSGTVVYTQAGGGTPIPAGGAVLVARGTQAARLQAEAPVGQLVTVRLVLKPEWREISQAMGGGPVIVRDGKPVFRANEVFTPEQLLPRIPRTAVGQRADGKIVMLAVDGRQPGYSVGMTNFELALAMARLGCVTASAFDSGGSTTMAFDGNLLNSPSDGVERNVADGLFVFYSGVYAPPVETRVVSPNGDGVAERQTLQYKVVRPSSVTVRILGPDQRVRFEETGLKEPGVYRVPWTGRTTSGAPEAQGRWQFVVTATDDEHRTSSAFRWFWLNNTLGFLKTDRVSLVVPRVKPRAIARVALTAAAAISAVVETQSGAPLATIASGRFQPGQLEIAWDGRNRNKTFVFPGRYVIRVTAKNAFGTTELTNTFTVRRVAAPA